MIAVGALLSERGFSRISKFRNYLKLCIELRRRSITFIKINRGNTFRKVKFDIFGKYLCIYICEYEKFGAPAKIT